MFDLIKRISLKKANSLFLFQEVFNCEAGGAEPLSIMYGTLLRSYEDVKEENTHVRKRFDELAASHSAAVAKLEHSQVRPVNPLCFFLPSSLCVIMEDPSSYTCYPIRR